MSAARVCDGIDAEVLNQRAAERNDLRAAVLAAAVAPSTVRLERLGIASRLVVAGHPHLWWLS